MGASRITLGKILAFAAVVEAATGLALMASPAFVVALLVGAEVSGAGTLLGRVLGIALVALGLACWPVTQFAPTSAPAFRAIFFYNVLIASYLAGEGMIWHREGLLLWPVVALHAVVALLLVKAWGDERWTRSGAGNQG
jgi:hypothetical protein